MPAGDGTGPMGLGPMTGRGAGYCAGFATPGYMNPLPGRGWGRGLGRGRGWGRGRGRGWGRGWFGMGWPGDYGMAPYPVTPPYSGTPSPEYEAQAMKAQAEDLEAALADIKKRIAELEGAEGKKG